MTQNGEWRGEGWPQARSKAAEECVKARQPRRGCYREEAQTPGSQGGTNPIPPATGSSPMGKGKQGRACEQQEENQSGKQPRYRL